MKKILANPPIVFSTRVFIGLLFIASSLDKIVDPAAFARSVANYNLLPSSLTMILATVLPWLELICGFAVLFGVLVRGSSLLLSVMIGVFLAALLSALFRGLDISCGCFTQDPAAEKIGWIRILEDFALLLLTLLLFFSESSGYTLYDYLRRSAPQPDSGRH